MKWFNDLCSTVGLLESDAEEHNRYGSFPKMIWDNEQKLKQWYMIRLSSKWEWLKRQRFMTKDKFE